MRAIAQQQSALRTPLNRILGTEARTRILRALVEAQTPVPTGYLATAAGLHERGVRRVVDELVDAGVVERIGAGTRRLVQLRPASPFATPLRALFGAEAARAVAVRDGIRHAAARVAPLPRAVWLHGPIATGSDSPADPVSVGVLADAADLDRVLAALREVLAPLELQQDITIETRGFTAGDLAALPPPERAVLAPAIPLFGPPPSALPDVAPPAPAGKRSRRAQTHADVDERAYRLASAVATLLDRDPSLVPKARARLAARHPEASPGVRRELEEWDRILRTMSVPRLRRFLVDRGQRATRLRQTLPFLDVLTPTQRTAITTEQPRR